ncbi:MAG TPA: hypothetical protein VGK73_39615, partial [Polyangiaceae bacterium]
MRFGIFVMLLSCGLGLLGCRADCESNCEEHKACTSVSEEVRARDCQDYCEQLEKHNTETGCADQYDALLACENSQE